jgi:hypothetical protein
MKISITNTPFFGFVVMASFACIPWLFDMAGFSSPLQNTTEHLFPRLVLFVVSGLGTTYILGGVLFFFLKLFLKNG